LEDVDMHHGKSGVCGCCGREHGKDMSGMKMMKKLFKVIPWKIAMYAGELGISEDQVVAIYKRHLEAKKQMIQIGSQIKIGMLDLEGSMMKEEIDMQAAESKIREIACLKGDKFLAMVQGINDMRNTLSHEQKRNVKGMILSWFKKDGMHGMPGMEMEEEGEESEG